MDALLGAQASASQLSVSKTALEVAHDVGIPRHSQMDQFGTMCTAYLGLIYRKRCNLLRNGHRANMPVQHGMCSESVEVQMAMSMSLQW